MAGTSVNRERAPKPSTVAPISFIALSSRSMALRASFTICLFRKFHSVRPGIEGDNAQTAALIGRRLGLRVELVGCTTCGLSSEIGRSSGPLPIEVEGRFALHPVGSGHRRCLMTDDTKQ